MGVCVCVFRCLCDCVTSVLTASSIRVTQSSQWKTLYKRMAKEIRMIDLFIDLFLQIRFEREQQVRDHCLIIIVLSSFIVNEVNESGYAMGFWLH